MDLMRIDSSDIERQIRQAEQMMHHPHRGMSAAPYPLMDGPVPELEHGLDY